MKVRLSNRLSPKAKKLALLGEEGEFVSALVKVAPNADVDALQLELTGLGAQISSWMARTRLLTIAVKASQLETLTNLEDVAYVDVATEYRR